MLGAGLKRNRLGSATGFGTSGDDAWRHPNTIISDRGGHCRQLHRRNADLLTHRNRTDGNLRPSIQWLRQPACLARQLDAGLLTKAEGANVLVKTFLAKAQCDLDRTHVT